MVGWAVEMVDWGVQMDGVPKAGRMGCRIGWGRHKLLGPSPTRGQGCKSKSAQGPEPRRDGAQGQDAEHLPEAGSGGGGRGWCPCVTCRRRSRRPPPAQGLLLYSLELVSAARTREEGSKNARRARRTLEEREEARRTQGRLEKRSKRLEQRSKRLEERTP